MNNQYQIKHQENTEVIIGNKIISKIDQIFKKYNHTKYIILSDSNTYSLFGEKLRKSLDNLNIPIISKVLTPGEKSKNMSSVVEVLEEMSTQKLDRKSAIIALGGGVIGDIATMIAGLYHRGIDCIQIPTTLLSQVDSSLGGKGGVNLGNMKNAIGLFLQPRLVVIDPSLLSTLPKSQIQSGMGEVLKYAIALDKEMFEMLEKSPEIIPEKLLLEVIKKCSTCKMEFVKRDPLDKTNYRAKLNFGHTLGHAIELVKGIPHGEAVATGMAFAVKLSINQKLLAPKIGDNVLNLIKKYNLPITVSNISIDEVMKNIRKDKKTLRDVANFVLLEDIGKSSYPHQIPEITIRKMLKEIIV